MRQQFQLTRFEYVSTIEFSNSLPIKDVDYISFFQEVGVSGGFTRKEFRYSFDNVTFTNWNTLTQSALVAINTRDEEELYLQVRYTRNSITSGNISEFYVFYESDTTSTSGDADPSINADTLGGELPQYFLNRENFYGPYTDLQVKNLPDVSSGFGVYNNRLDTSTGTTLWFKTIGALNENVIVTEDVSGKILIGIDVSIIDLKNDVSTVEASLAYLYQYNDVQDASIVDLRNINNIQDVSILSLDNRLSIVDGSITYLFDWNTSQDASIVDLRDDVSTLFNDVSIIDASIDYLTTWNNIQDSSIQQNTTDISGLEASVVRIDSSLNTIFDDIEGIDASLEELYTENDVQDSSIEDLRSDISTLDSSVTYLTSWNISQDSSIEGLRSDVSTLDSSVAYLTSWNVSQDSSIEGLRSDISTLDSSVNNIFQYQDIQDVSIQQNTTDISGLEASVVRIDSSLNEIFGDLTDVDASLNELYNENDVQDSSIEDLRSDISTLDSSVAYLTSWNVSQDSSIEGLRSDVSIIDASIENIQLYQDIQDSSIQQNTSDITGLEASVIRIDSSITDLYGTVEVLDGSLYIETLRNDSQDASIEGLRSDISILDSSIVRIDSSVSDIYNRLDITDASVAFLLDVSYLNIGDGSIGLFAGTDTSGNVLLKSVDWTGPVNVIDDGSTVLIDSSIIKRYDTDLSTNIEMYNTVGGLVPGTSVGYLNLETYTEILNRMLFPLYEPSIIEPSIVSFTTDVTVAEKESDISFELVTTIDKGSISLNGLKQEDRTGDVSTYYFDGPGIGSPFTVVTTDSSASFTSPPLLDVEASIGMNSWITWVTYEEGPQPLDSYGNPDGSILVDGSLSASVDFEVVYPLFATSVDIDVSTKQSLVSMLNGNNIEISLVSESGGKKQRFFIPQAWEGSPTNRPLVSVQTNDSGEWRYEGGDASVSLQYWDVSTINEYVNNEEISVPYNVYTYNGIDRGSVKIRLQF